MLSPLSMIKKLSLCFMPLPIDVVVHWNTFRRLSRTEASNRPLCFIFLGSCSWDWVSGCFSCSKKSLLLFCPCNNVTSSKWPCMALVKPILVLFYLLFCRAIFYAFCKLGNKHLPYSHWFLLNAYFSQAHYHNCNVMSPKSLMHFH